MGIGYGWPQKPLLEPWVKCSVTGWLGEASVSGAAAVHPCSVRKAMHLHQMHTVDTREQGEKWCQPTCVVPLSTVVVNSE